MTFITFEGGEGAGKTTQIRLLAEHLRAQGRSVVITREPGGSEGAEAIRNLLVTGDTDRWDALSELYLLMAARRDHVLRVIRPALAAQQLVLCDRFIDSTRVYQGLVKGLADELICQHHDEATQSLWPDRTFWLDIPANAGLARAQQRTDNEGRFESENLSFHNKLRDGFARLAEIEPARIERIDAMQSIEAVAAAIRMSIGNRL